jgi:hypothetical protein
MYEQQRWCTDVLDQLAAVRRPLDGPAVAVVWQHSLQPLALLADVAMTAVAHLDAICDGRIRDSATPRTSAGTSCQKNSREATPSLQGARM